MSVLIECISVVVRRSAIERVFPGGLEGYLEIVPNQAFCCDTHLTRAGFMHPDDVGAFVTELQRHGLRFLENETFVEIAIVDQMQGPSRPCGWLSFSREAEGWSKAWLTGRPEGDLSVPAYWNSESTRSIRFAASTESIGHVTHPSKEEWVIAENPETGQQAFVARIEQGHVPCEHAHRCTTSSLEVAIRRAQGNWSDCEECPMRDR